jgi:hypothetical protein
MVKHTDLHTKAEGAARLAANSKRAVTKSQNRGKTGGHCEQGENNAPDRTTLQLSRKPGQTDCQALTESALNPAINCTHLVTAWHEKQWSGIGMTEAMELMKAKAQAINAGDLREAETALFAQATSLHAIFIEMTRRAGLNMGTHLDATEVYMRMALKAQAQSRATLETLAAIKNPPGVVFARQANFANGHQQVNNGVAAPAASHAAKTESPQSQLLESSNGERLDFGAQAAAGAVDPHLATVGAVHGAEDARGQGHHGKERRQGRVVAPGARGPKGVAREPKGAAQKPT